MPQKHFNDLSQSERAQLLKGPYGNHLISTISRSTAIFEWGNLAEDVPHHGSVFFIKPDRIPLAVTARHVYEAYTWQVESDPHVKCQINEIGFNPKERLVGIGADCDVATFWLTPAEFNALDRITTPWPPLMPKVGEIVLFAGLPALVESVRISE